MPGERSEQQLLEETVDRALTETEVKVGRALEGASSRSDGFVRDVWAAAEASEYTCLVYSLAYDLDGLAVSETGRGEPPDPSSVLGDASQKLEQVRTLRGKGDKRSIHEGYSLLRGATDSLRRSYLDLTKPSRTVKERSS